jgi:hypothetical protein
MEQKPREHGWEKTRGHLANAHEVFATIRMSPDTRALIERYLEHLECYELEQAMESLAEAGDNEAVPRAFWIALRDAAVSLGLNQRATEFLKRAEQA